MKGWQYRWFVLDYNAGLLSYYTVRQCPWFINAQLIPSSGELVESGCQTDKGRGPCVFQELRVSAGTKRRVSAVTEPHVGH